jgi:hypothetical protein
MSATAPISGEGSTPQHLTYSGLLLNIYFDGIEVVAKLCLVMSSTVCVSDLGVQ